MLRTLIALAALLLSMTATAEDAALADLFAKHKVDGTIVVSSLATGKTFTHNDRRAAQRLAPASTFKILNTLIAVQEGVVSGADDAFKWDGTSYEFPSWNRDQTLASAFKVSCVWCYQELARKVGSETYRDYLERVGYGELRQPFGLTTFWLDGSLRISADEQVAFLKRLHAHALPFSDRAYAVLRNIMQTEQTAAYTLWAKTGWATLPTPQVGWYVGYLETPRDTWFFALNMTIHSPADLALRRQVVMEALRTTGAID